MSCAKCHSRSCYDIGNKFGCLDCGSLTSYDGKLVRDGHHEYTKGNEPLRTAVA